MRFGCIGQKISHNWVNELWKSCDAAELITNIVFLCDDLSWQIGKSIIYLESITKTYSANIPREIHRWANLVTNIESKSFNSEWQNGAGFSRTPWFEPPNLKFRFNSFNFRMQWIQFESRSFVSIPLQTVWARIDQNSFLPKCRYTDKSLYQMIDTYVRSFFGSRSNQDIPGKFPIRGDQISMSFKSGLRRELRETFRPYHTT
jgi:hypothetical protein